MVLRLILNMMYSFNAFYTISRYFLCLWTSKHLSLCNQMSDLAKQMHRFWNPFLCLHSLRKNNGPRDYFSDLLPKHLKNNNNVLIVKFISYHTYFKKTYLCVHNLKTLIISLFCHIPTNGLAYSFKK